MYIDRHIFVGMGELASEFSREHEYIQKKNRSHTKVHMEALTH